MTTSRPPLSALIAEAMPVSRWPGSLQSNCSVMLDSPLAPVLARTSLRSSLAVAFGRSLCQPLTCRGDESGPAGQVASRGDVDELACAGERFDGARRCGVVVLDRTAA